MMSFRDSPDWSMTAWFRLGDWSGVVLPLWESLYRVLGFFDSSPRTRKRADCSETIP